MKSQGSGQDYGQKKGNEKKIQGYVPDPTVYQLQSAKDVSTSSRTGKSDKKSSKYSTQRDYMEENNESEFDEYPSMSTGYQYDIASRDAPRYHPESYYEEHSQPSHPKSKPGPSKEDHSHSSKNKYDKGIDFQGDPTREAAYPILSQKSPHLDMDPHLPGDKGGYEGIPYKPIGSGDGGSIKSNPQFYQATQPMAYPQKQGGGTIIPPGKKGGPKIMEDSRDSTKNYGPRGKRGGDPPDSAYLHQMNYPEYNYNYCLPNMNPKYKGGHPHYPEPSHEIIGKPYSPDAASSSGKDKLNELISLTSSKHGSEYIYPVAGPKGRQHMSHHPPYDYQSHGYPAVPVGPSYPTDPEPYKPYEKRLDKEVNSRSSKDNSQHNKQAELKRLIKERENVALI